jgi:hypothetical protein
MVRWTLVFLAFAIPAFAQPIRDDLWVTNGFVYTETILGNTMYIGGNFNRIGPATGGFMPTNATTGARTLPGPAVDGAINAIVADGSGNYIIGGSFKHYQGVERDNIAKVDANGDLLAWNPGVNGVVPGLAVGGGRVFVGGEFTTVGGIARTNAACVDLTSWAVASWAPNPTLPVHCMAYQNGLVYMGGEFFDVAGTQRAHAGSFDAVTGAATNWQPNTDGTVYTMAVKYDVINIITTVYIGGNFTVAGGAFRRNFALIDATPNAGTFSQALNFDPSPDGTVRVIRVVGNTIYQVYVGGDFTNIAGTARGHIAKFNGTTLTSFNPSPNGSVIEIAPSGSNLYIGGYFTTVDQALRGYAALISNTTGGVQPWDAGAGNAVHAFALNGSTVWIGGEFTTIGALGCSNLAALDLITGRATLWLPAASGPVYALEAIGGMLYAGGQFGGLGGQGHLNIGRIDVNGNADATWNPAALQPVYAIASRPLAPSGNVIYVGGPFTSFMGQPRNHLAALTDAVPATLLSWNPNAGSSGDVRALAVDNQYVYAGGYFTGLAGIAGLGRIDFNGLVSPWNPHTQQPVTGITLTNSTVYATFPGVNFLVGGPRTAFAEIDKSTGAVTPWMANADPPAVGFVVRRLGNDVYVGGLVEQLNGQTRSMLGDVDAVSNTVLPFAPSPSSWIVDPSPKTYYQLPAVLDMEENHGAMYVVGQFTNIGGKPHSGVAAIYLSTVGVPDEPAASVALRAFPNPAPGNQTFSFPALGEARLSLYDASGRMVRSFSASGLSRVVWDGLSGSGQPVPPGLYFARLESGSTVVTTKVLRVDH